MASNFKTLKALIKKFSLEDLENVIPAAIGIRWTSINKRLYECKLAFNRKNIADIAVSIYQGKSPSRDVIANACGKLQIFDVVLNNKTLWKCKKLECRLEDFPEVDELEERLVRAFKREAKNAEVKIYENEPLVFIMCKEMIQKKNVKSYKAPVFFVIHLGLDEQYFFHSKLNETNKIYLSFICDALNYENCSTYPLEGDDVKNMFDMILRSQSEIEIENVDFKPVVKQVGNRLDFTQEKARMEYATKKIPRDDLHQKFHCSCKYI